jgi:hypothetical protein
VAIVGANSATHDGENSMPSMTPERFIKKIAASSFATFHFNSL